MASTAGSRSGWCNRTACRSCGLSGNRATMRPRNKVGQDKLGQAKACPTNATRAPARVGHALACQRPLAGAFFLGVPRRSLIAGAILLSLAVAAVWAQQQTGPAIFRADTRLVVCHTTVVDKNGHLVTTLAQDAFTVYENGVLQPIKIFHREDVPVSMGLIIDNSGSMRDKRAKVEAAALTLVKDSNPDDEVFIVNFNDEAFLDNPHGKAFTNDIKEMEEALTRIDSRGGTAMRDAIRMSIDHLKEKAHKDKKVLVVVTDGNDNAS